MTPIMTRSRANSKREVSRFNEINTSRLDGSSSSSSSSSSLHSDVSSSASDLEQKSSSSSGPKMSRALNASTDGEGRSFLSSLLILLLCIGLGTCHVSSTSSPDMGTYLGGGSIGLLGVCLFLALNLFPDGPFIRPNTFIWRLILGFGLFYICVLVPFIFIPLEDARQILKLVVDSTLGKPLPSRSYAENCELSWGVIIDQMDIFVFLHIFGWIFKALIFRDAVFCWVLSICFELLEYSLQHQLPNFAECWWDHWLLDVLLCNAGGILFGMILARLFCIKMFSLASSYDKEKKPTLLAFKSFQNYLQVLLLLAASLIFELIAFYLKHLLWIPTVHFINAARLLLVTFLGLGAVREIYDFFSESFERPHRPRPFATIASLILVFECVVCIRWSQGQFPVSAPFEITIAALALGIIFLVVIPAIIFLVFPLYNKQKHKTK